jgi:hypothetical protein
MSELILLDYERPKARRRPRAGVGGPAAGGRRGEPGGEGPGRARPHLRVVPRPAAGDGAAGAVPGSPGRGAGRLVLLRGQKTLVVW